jgi:uncharacterized protein (DUF362 family)
MIDLFLNSAADSYYPSFSNNYNPDTFYPEYKWGELEISAEKNYVYDMVRSCLIGMNLDAKNYNTKNWNPLGDIIREGDTVVLKPNWVMHYNKNKHVTKNSLECMITHPSVVRAVIDYCLIALNGSGKIVVGDAPMQGCDLDRLLEISGYDHLFKFYKHQSIDIQPVDFRQYCTVVDKNKVLRGRRYNSSEGIEVNLAGRSRLGTNNNLGNMRYKVSDYNENVTNKFHKDSEHIYLINRDILDADVFINLSKPKCHRLAGITSSLKNIVGITYDKACLPHRTVGSKEQGGDEYLYNSLLKKAISQVLGYKLLFEERKYFGLSLMMRYTYGVLYYMMKWLSKDKYLVGSWYGNDTIWRTVLDLYEILLYSDKDGNIQDTRQRKIFNIADMIISGERNGPVAPEPKNLGVILAGHDSVKMDKVVCKLMGFDFQKVPTVREAIKDSRLNVQSDEPIYLSSNIPEYENKALDDINFPDEWNFKPYDTWKGNIELAEKSL